MAAIAFRQVRGFFYSRMQELVFATHNRNKALEIQDIIRGRYRILTLDDAGYTDELPEEWDTLDGNALQKARHVYRQLGRDCFADDTGLEVAALGGLPGVYSARFAEMSGERMPGETVSEANIRKLLRQMDGVSDRRARFRTVIALVMGEEHFTFEGTVEGQILVEKRGKGGFGYDPVFLPDGYRKTFAEMPLSEKNSISHRARAVGKLVEFLKNYGSG